MKHQHRFTTPFLAVISMRRFLKSLKSESGYEIKVTTVHMDNMKLDYCELRCCVCVKLRGMWEGLTYSREAGWPALGTQIQDSEYSEIEDPTNIMY